MVNYESSIEGDDRPYFHPIPDAVYAPGRYKAMFAAHRSAIEMALTVELPSAPDKTKQSREERSRGNTAIFAKTIPKDAIVELPVDEIIDEDI